MWSDFSQYIITNYAHTDKIVEVGVGRFLEVALTLKKHLKVDIIMTDIKPFSEKADTEILQDDICHPNLKIYKGASLIYSIRPPEELHIALVRVAEKVGSDLIIKTYSEDSINTPKKMKLINYKKAIFYQGVSYEMD
jgi:uncharacterized UPF0146 family protein